MNEQTWQFGHTTAHRDVQSKPRPSHRQGTHRRQCGCVANSEKHIQLYPDQHCFGFLRAAEQLQNRFNYSLSVCLSSTVECAVES